MDRSKNTDSRASSLDKLETKSSNLQETIFKKFKFLGTLKNYIISKLRNAKYELSSESKQEISIISYDQHSFDEVEREFDFQTAQTIRIDEQILQSLKKVLDARITTEPKRRTDHELLEIVEKTFARQLDIFEALLKLINTDKSTLKDTVEEEMLDLNEIVKNLVTELTSLKSKCEEVTISVIDRGNDPQIEKNLGDNPEVKTENVSCECQKASGSGAAVPSSRC